MYLERDAGVGANDHAPSHYQALGSICAVWTVCEDKSEMFTGFLVTSWQGYDGTI